MNGNCFSGWKQEEPYLDLRLYGLELSTKIFTIFILSIQTDRTEQNSVDEDQMLQNMVSDQGLYYLPLIAGLGG